MPNEFRDEHPASTYPLGPAPGRCSRRLTSERATALVLPETWQREATPSAFELGDWGQFQTPALDRLLAATLAQNRALARQHSQVEAARQGVAVSRAARLPSLNKKERWGTGLDYGGECGGGEFWLKRLPDFELDAWGWMSDCLPIDGVTSAPILPCMDRIANLRIERLPEGVYLATSDEIPGLVAQGRTIAEAVEIARDVAEKLLEAQADPKPSPGQAALGSPCPPCPLSSASSRSAMPSPCTANRTGPWPPQEQTQFGS